MQGLWLLLLLLLLLSAAISAAATKNVYDFKNVKDIDGNAVNLGDFRGKPLLIVNVASQCGYTQQNYKELQQLHQKYKDDLVIMAFPCNQFGKQEPASLAEIKAFAQKKKKVTFRMMAKVFVNGKKQHPLFRFLKQQAAMRDIEWNFGKFLVHPDGETVEYYDSTTSPINDIEPNVRNLLQKTEL